jgi:hypothetical protein
LRPSTIWRLMTHPQVAEVVADPNLDHAQVFSLLTGMMKRRCRLGAT